MITELLALIQAAAPNYEATYEEAKMMNVAADLIDRTKGFIYVEEYYKGSYLTDKYMPAKRSTLQIYFCKFIDFHGTALDREVIRKEIESDAVMPVINALKANTNYPITSSIDFSLPLPRFDANEVSIMIQFSITEYTGC